MAATSTATDKSDEEGQVVATFTAAYRSDEKGHVANGDSNEGGSVRGPMNMDGGENKSA